MDYLTGGICGLYFDDMTVTSRATVGATLNCKLRWDWACWTRTGLVKLVKRIVNIHVCGDQKENSERNFILGLNASYFLTFYPNFEWVTVKVLIKDHVQHRFKQKVSHLVCLNTNRILFDGKFASCFCILSVFRRCDAGREIAIQSTLQRISHLFLLLFFFYL